MQITVKIDNKLTNALVSTPNRNLHSFSVPVRLIYVSKFNRWVEAGMILESANHGKMLLGKHHDSGVYRGFYGISVNAEISAVRTITATHPVTGLAGDRASMPAIKLSAVHYSTTLDDMFGLPLGKNYLILGQAVDRDWELNGQRVSTVIPRIGLYFVEVSNHGQNQ